MAMRLRFDRIVNRYCIAFAALSFLLIVTLSACERYERPPQSSGESGASVSGGYDPRCVNVSIRNGEYRCESYRVSIYGLLANPAAWDGKDVVVVGYASIGFEHSAIYPHKEDLDHAIMQNGLWLVASDSVSKHLGDTNSRNRKRFRFSDMNSSMP